MKTVTLTTLEETSTLAQEIARSVHGGDLIALSGDLGSGKTTFTQALAKALGIERRLISPTFVIVRTYAVEGNTPINRFYHIDLYRLENEQQLATLGLEELLGDTQAITVVEWPEKAGQLLRPTIHLTFSYVDETTRTVVITYGQ